MNVLVFDTETTGFIPGQICQLSYVRNKKTNGVEYLKGKNYFFKVDSVEEKASEVHGLTKDRLDILSGGNIFEDSYKEILHDFNNVDYIVAHNLKFDVRFMDAELKKVGFNNFTQKFLEKSFCTMENGMFCGVKNKLGHAKKPNLQELKNYFNIEDNVVHALTTEIFNEEASKYHDARVDIIATLLSFKQGLRNNLFVL